MGVLVSLPNVVLAAPVISNTRVLETSSSGSIILWNTDVPSTTEIEYGTTTVYDSALPANTKMDTSHTVTLQYLLPSTTYHFIVKSADSNGERTVSSDGSFTTLASTSSVNSGTVPTLESPKGPVISNIKSTSTDRECVVSWSTDVPSDSLVEYGLTNEYGSKIGPDYTSTTLHTLKMSGLKNKTAYHFRVKSIGLNGYSTLSDDSTCTTLDVSVLAPNVTVSPPVQDLTIQIPQKPIEKIIFPYGVKEGEIIKFKKHPAIYVVRLSGLYPFATWADYQAFLKIHPAKLRIFDGDGGPYTKRNEPAWVY